MYTMKKNQITYLLTSVFTITYVIRAIVLLLEATLSMPPDKFVFQDEFRREMFRNSTKILWDLPAIFSTVYLNCGLIRNLNKE